MTEIPQLTVIVPAYDEIENLRLLLPEMNSVLRESQQILSYEIVVVLPTFSSTDEMTEIAKLGANPVRRSPTNSFGDAVRSGIRSIPRNSVYTIFMDADGSHKPSTLQDLCEADPKAHVVVASRYVRGGHSENSFILRLMSRVLNLAYSLILGIRCRDVSTSYKRYLSSDLKDLVLKGNDFDVVEELLFRVRKLHGDDFVLLEIPDVFLERAKGVSKRKLGPFIISYLVSMYRLSREEDEASR